jgi:serpin B
MHKVMMFLLVMAMLSGVAGAQSSASGTMPAGNLPFSMSFFQALRANTDAENMFFSPYSIQAAFTLAWAGADGETAAQMGRALGYGVDTFDQLAAAGMPAQPAMSQGAEGAPSFTLRSANALWGQQDFPWLSSYLDLMRENNAPLQLVDYTADPEAVREQINQWVEDQTEDKIEDLIPQGVIDSLTRMVIANAIYFNANWLYPFGDELTQDAPFNLLDGSTVDVPTMQMRADESFLYVDGDGYIAIALPYEGGSAEMLLIVPDAGQYEAVEAMLTPEKYAEIRAALVVTRAQVWMPRFSFEQSVSLRETMEALGITAAFDSGTADFSRMYDQSVVEDRLYISAALHKAFIDVDEQGTEAAAATAVIIGLASAPMPQPFIEVRIDRPFFFTIEDPTTSTILFGGRVLNPAE